MELTKIKGIGPSRAKSFEENDIFSCEDLVNYFPYKYYDFSKTEPYADDGNVRLIKATAIENPKLIRARKNLTFVSCKMNDEVGQTFSAVWFNQTYIKTVLYLGINIYLFGKNSPNKKNTFNVLMMKREEDIQKLKTGLLPVYHSIDGIGQSTINITIIQSLEMLQLSSIIPERILSKYNLLNLKQAYNLIHNPQKSEDIETARDRIEIENLLPVFYSNEKQKIIGKTTRKNNYKNITKIRSEFENLLPFKLTADQSKAIDDISKDFESAFSMNRLLQGDVGSGKTVVALFCAYAAARSGFQSAIIAPTEILAKQHYEIASKLFENQNVSVCILTSSTSSLERKIILQKLKMEDGLIVIGTHSLLLEEVCFKNLSMVIIDEQHRFGVAQRTSMREKGHNPDMLALSATPIPRTLSMTVYGDMDISIINEKPAGRLPIKTTKLPVERVNALLERIAPQIKNGAKVFWVCPLVEESENVDMMAAEARFKELKKHFPGTGLCHGQMDKKERDKVMAEFADENSKMRVLVSTTVIEVGIDVPSATIMVIENAERFGLAALHQLRGRVGRGALQSYCILLYGNNVSPDGLKRLDVLCETDDGFVIAEQDLMMRGVGELLGTKQSGWIQYHFVNYREHRDLFKLAQSASMDHNISENAWAKQLRLVFDCSTIAGA